MIGTIINGVAIVAGGIVGSLIKKNISPTTQLAFRFGLGVLVVFVGISMTISAVREGSAGAIKELGIMFGALILGNLLGQTLRLQKGMDRLGGFAKKQFEKSDSKKASSFSEGFVTCTLIFCLGPMALLGAISDGLHGDYRTLALKSVMDGVSTIFFVSTLGRGAVFAAIPVVIYQGTITLLAQLIGPYLTHPDLIPSIHGTGGLLLICVSVIVFDTKKVPITNYLPALAIAPLLTWIFT
jgi:uncharacterized membrane protein YqgA involved in biofilm formation